MISSVSDYHYVTGANIDDDHPHGDMDRIIIDGDIMPLREGTLSPTTGVDRSRILRGEDICFIFEALLERIKLYRTITFGDAPHSRTNSLISLSNQVFQRAVKHFNTTIAQQLFDVFAIYISYLCGKRGPNSDYVGMLKSDITTGVFDGDLSWQQLNGDKFLLSSDVGYNYSGPNYGSKLEKAPIKSAFDAVRMMTHPCIGLPGAGWNERVVQIDSQGDAPAPPQPSSLPVDVFIYRSVRSWAHIGEGFSYTYCTSSTEQGLTNIIEFDNFPLSNVKAYYRCKVNWGYSSGTHLTKTVIVEKTLSFRPTYSFIRELMTMCGVPSIVLDPPVEGESSEAFSCLITIDSCIATGTMSDRTIWSSDS